MKRQMTLRLRPSWMGKMRVGLWRWVGVSLLLLSQAAWPAHASVQPAEHLGVLAVYTVTTTANSGAGSLRRCWRWW